MSLLTLLKAHDLFHNLPPAVIEEVSAFSRDREFRPLEWVCQYDTPAKYVFLLLKGRAQLRLPTKTGDYSLLISQVEEGHFLGLSALVGVARYTASVQAVAPSTVVCIEAAPFREILRANPAAGFEVMDRVARGYSERYHQVLLRLHGVLDQITLVS